jgi:acyl-CoA reductase-like NAD-dependent aldehyde dehydrogenase
MPEETFSVVSVCNIIILRIIIIRLEVVEHSCSAATLMMGETVENVSKNVDTYSYKQPLGVCGGITPFNFPAMIPLWVFVHFFALD